MATLAKLRDKLNTALRKERFGDALRIYDELSVVDPKEPRWPHRKGDLLKRIGKEHHAVDAYEQAVTLYASAGFVARAAAMAKVILEIEPSRTDVLESVRPEEARRLHRRQRRSSVSALEDDLILEIDDDVLEVVSAVPTAPALPNIPEPAGPPPPPPAPRRRKSFTFDAVTLERVVDGDDDEIRFLDLEDDEDAIEIDLSEIELVGRDAPPPLPKSDATNHGGDHAGPTAAEVARLPSMPLFAEVPLAVLRRIVMESNLLDLKDRELLIKKGDHADSVFAIIEGNVAVEMGSGQVSLGEGDIVGESCLLDDVRRRAEVTAVGHVRALEIPKTVLDQLVEEHAAVGDLLLELLTRRLIGNLLVNSPLFSAFDPGTRKELASLFEVRRLEEGTTLMASGKRSDGLYIPLLGRLDALHRGDVHKVSLGQMIGQRSLLTQSPSEIDARAGTDVLLLRLPASRFNELAAMYPSVLEHLSNLAAEPVSTLEQTAF